MGWDGPGGFLAAAGPKKRTTYMAYSSLKLTELAHKKSSSFLGKCHQNGGFSMAMLVYRSVFSIVCLKSIPPMEEEKPFPSNF